MITLILVGVVTFLFFVYFKNKYSYWEKRGIKGPRPIPFFGTMFSELGPDPGKIEDQFLKEYGSVFGTYFGTKPVLNTSNPDHIKKVMADLKIFPLKSTMDFTDKYLKNSILLKNGLDWKTTRAAQTHYFTSKRFRNLLGHFETVTNNFLENLKEMSEKNETKEFEVKQLSKFLTLDVIAKVLFAIDVNSFKERDTVFVRSAMTIGNLNKIQGALATMLPKSIVELLGLSIFDLGPLNELGDFFKKVLKDRRKSGIKYNDLSEVIQEAVDNGKANLTEDEIIGNILLAFFAGIQPVSHVLAQMFRFLSEYPDVQTKLYNEIVKEFSDEITYEKLTQNPYLDAVVNEVMRLGNLVLILTRTAAMDTKLDDIEVEKDTEIRLIVYGPHMSSDKFMDPRTFNPDRFLKNSPVANNDETGLFVPFGLGPKLCLGQRLALLEIKYLFARLLQKYEVYKAKDPKMKLQTFRGFTELNAITIGLRERC